MLQSYHEIIRRISGNNQRENSPHRRQESIDEEEKRELERQDSASTEYLVHNWLEATFAWFQVIILWHEPQISICAISGLLSSFLLLTYFAPRFYATIMIAIFIYNFNKFWFRHVWPEIRVPPGGDRDEELRLDVDRWTYLHPQLMTLKEFRNHIRNLIKLIEGYSKRLLLMRNERPAYFCSQLCFIFSCTACLGRTISGLTLVFCILVIIISAPGIYAHLLPEPYKRWLKQKYLCLIAIHESLSADDNQPQTHPGGQDVEDAATAIRNPTAGPRSWDTVQASIASNIKSIESNFRKFANLKTNEPHKSTTSTSSTTTTSGSADLQSEKREEPTSSTALSSLRQDGARVLYNLIDVTLMGSGSKDGGTSECAEVNSDAELGSEESSVTETMSLVGNEDEQQEEGFVML